MSALIETKENDSLELLQTHYYRASYTQIKKAYLEILEGLGHNIISVNDDYYEIFSDYGKLEVTAKIIMQSPIETSIDFTISSDYFLAAASKAYKFISTVLEELGKKFELKGLGLYK